MKVLVVGKVCKGDRNWLMHVCLDSTGSLHNSCMCLTCVTAQLYSLGSLPQLEGSP